MLWFPQKHFSCLHGGLHERRMDGDLHESQWNSLDLQLCKLSGYLIETSAPQTCMMSTLGT